jgi:8-oxo-dGTP pyrophosphatase MutT (NUDIX family)
MSKTKAEISQLLLQGPRVDLSNSFSRASGVALVLCKTNELELLFIRRAINPLDNWSGQIAFPGGKRDPSDISLLEACLREVREEVALNLSPEALIGSLNDLQARRKGHPLEFYVQPFVFFLSERPAVFAQASEVAEAFWVPLKHLQEAGNHTHYVFDREGMQLSLPAIRLPTGDTLWGLSHMMVMNLLSVIKPLMSSKPSSN